MMSSCCFGRNKTIKSNGTEVSFYRDVNGSYLDIGKSFIGRRRSSLFASMRRKRKAEKQPVDEKRHQLETRLLTAESEFETIPRCNLQADCSVGKQQSNESRNRSTKVLPYDNNRIRLTPTILNQSGYVNASTVKLKLPGSSRRQPPTLNWRFISAQLPQNDDTELHLWQMVFEKNISIIVLMESDENCKFWNKEAGKIKRSNGEYSVLTRCVDKSSTGYVTWGLQIKNYNSGKEVNVWQLELTNWPNSDAFMSLLQECRTLKMSYNDSSLLVMCKDGAGKSGVFMLADVMTLCLELNADVDPPKVLKSIREQRMFSVQTAEEYMFVYKTLIRFLDKSRLI